jgi:hypothetical protein
VGPKKLPPDGDLSRDIELGLQLLLPLRCEELRADDQNIGKPTAGNKFAHNEPGADCFPEAYVVRKKGYRQTAAIRDEIRDLVVIGSKPVVPELL